MKMLRLILVLSGILFTFGLTSPPVQAQENDPLAPALRAAVQILVYDFATDDIIGSGSGSLVREDGYIITNYHVIAESLEHYQGWVAIRIPEANDPNQAYAVKGRVVIYSEREDLAIVHIETDWQNRALGNITFPTVPLGDAADLRQGEELYAIGYPGTAFGSRIVTKGIFSGHHEQGGLTWVLSDANIAGGNSGGLLITGDGRLVAIPTKSYYVVDRGDKLGYSRPINAALPLVDAAVQPTTNTDPTIYCEDDFTSNDGIWPLGYNESDNTEREDRIAGGALHSSVYFKRDVYAWINAPDCTVENFVFIIDAQLHRSADDDNAIVINLRQQEAPTGENNYYQVLYYRDGSYEVNLRYNGQWEELQPRTTSNAFALLADTMNTFAVRMVGSELTIFANGERLTTIFNDALPEAGEIGLGVVGDANESVYATFDNFTVIDHRPEGVLFYDYFIDNHNDWELSRINNEQVDCEDRIENGRLEHRITVKAGNRSCHSTAPDLVTQDFWLEVEANMLEVQEQGRWLSIAFRYDEATYHQYQLRIDDAGSYTLELYYQEEWHTLQRWTRSAVIDLNSGEPHTIQLWVRGSQITVSINDVELTTINDDRLLAAGKIMPGLGAEAGVSNFVRFDNFVIQATRPAMD